MKNRTTKTPTRFLLLAVCALTLALSGVFAPSAMMQQQGGTYTLKPSVIAGGGGASTGAATKVEGTIGQSVAGLSSGGSFSLNAGFWQGGAPCAAAGIATPPTDQTACAGSPVSFAVVASGAIAAYQWRKNGASLSNGGNVSGATDATLTLNPVGANDAGSYDVVINGACGGAPVTSAAATLTVNGYDITPAAQGFTASGGSGGIAITAAASCSWTAQSNDAWIIVNSGSQGSGSGVVNYSVMANPGSGRTGSMTVAGQTFTVTQASPSRITLIALSATAYDKGVFIEWRTGFEADNLGFNLYRDEGGKLSRINPQMLAGSALKFGQHATLGSGCAYSWWDDAPAKGAQYWLEDIDLNGQTTWHGPALMNQAGAAAPARAEQARALASLVSADTKSSPVAPRASFNIASGPGSPIQAAIAAGAALKIAVSQTGLYRLAAADLLRAGLDPATDPRTLQLFVDGRQVPIIVNGEEDGRLDAADSVEFYGLGAASPFTDRRVYWLVAGKTQGRRIAQLAAAAKPNPGGSFAFTVERKDRTTYFSSLRNGEAENFFGAVLAGQPLLQTLDVTHLDTSAAQDATLEVVMQGVTEFPHQFTVQLNGAMVGAVTYQGQASSSSTFNVPASLLSEGENVVTLSPTGPAADVSLVDCLRLTYQRRFTATGNALPFAAQGQQQVTVNGFADPSIRVFDVTEMDSPQELTGYVAAQGADYSISLTVPGFNPRSLVASSETAFRRDAAIIADRPSSWRAATNGADFVIITRRELMNAVETLKRARQAQGLSVAVVDIEDLYDEFSYGQKTPYAVRDFLAYARRSWKTPVRYALFVGDASYDAKNYLGLGDYDLVPTRLIDTSFMEAASDDWLADANGDGVADFGIGRLPARNAAEAETMIAKILAYDRAAPVSEALFVADRNDGFDFENAVEQLSRLMPAGVKSNKIKRGQVGDEAAKAALIDAINRGQRFVNYSGHGSLDSWHAALLTTDDVGLLTNKALPVFVMMTCLNGYFNDPSRDSLSESLMKQAQGGAVAVWASSAMTYPDSQVAMNQELYKQLAKGGARLGDAVIAAKAAIADRDVRASWILFGDPTMPAK